MKGLLRNSMFLLVAGILVLSVSGFNVYLHHCSCEGMQYLTTLPSPACCGDEITAAECCGTDSASPSCCSEGENNCTNTTQISKSACCTTHHYFIRLSTDFDYQIKQNPVKLIAVDYDNFTTEEYSIPLLSCIPAVFYTSLPLLLHGKELLNYLHQRRIDC